MTKAMPRPNRIGDGNRASNKHVPFNPRTLDYDGSAGVVQPGYSAATAASGMNCDAQTLRRFRLARYSASNSASGKEWVDGRLSSACAQAFSRGYLSMMPSGLTRSRQK